MRYGRMYDGVVVAVTEPPVGTTIGQHVGNDQENNYTQLPDHVGVGYQQDFDGNWTPPKPKK